MNGDLNDNPERLVKSVQRVRDLGEVFTPATTVRAMLDLLPEDIWQPHPPTTFLEPACGDGNFLVAILQRKLTSIEIAYQDRTLPAGTDADAFTFHCLQALASIYAVDISPDNVVGGTPGHEVGARHRLLDEFHGWQRSLGAQLNRQDIPAKAAAWIVERNILVGSMLPVLPDGGPSGRKELPIVEYRFHPGTLSVTVYQTTLGAVMEEAVAETSGIGNLFSTEPEFFWSGPAIDLYEAPIPGLERPKNLGPKKTWMETGRV
jgi:hypothetical protein